VDRTTVSAVVSESTVSLTPDSVSTAPAVGATPIVAAPTCGTDEVVATGAVEVPTSGSGVAICVAADPVVAASGNTVSVVDEHVSSAVKVTYWTFLLSDAPLKQNSVL
jgi:hypothetical protein